MTSPATDAPLPNSAGVRATRRLKWLLWALGLVVAAPVIVTVIGAATSPPHVRGVPTGHLVYLDADQPSEKTTILRGLYLSQPNDNPRLLIHENEPQDTDAGIREWITQPAASPDGTQVAYIKQNIVLEEETHSQDTQLWVLSTAAPEPRMLLDLTKRHLKEVVGLSWTLDGRDIVFANDDHLFLIPSVPGLALVEKVLAPLPPSQTSSAAPGISTVRDPQIVPGRDLTTEPVVVPGADLCVTVAQDAAIATLCGSVRYPGVNIVRLSPDGRQIAFCPDRRAREVRVSDAQTGRVLRDIPGRWGWSIFGGRHITSLRWSPDGRYLAYTVSKPPVPEDELFYVDLAGGKTFQLPVRTGRAAWDWTR